MILNSQSISNESETFNDYRYQKALKQISKLINVNRQIKIQSQKCRNQYQQLSHKNTQLLEINSSLQQQNTMLRQQLQQVNISYTQLQQFCTKTQHQQKQLIKSNQLQSQQKIEIEQRHSLQIQQMEGHFREQINTMMGEINRRDQHIHQLQEKLQYSNQLQAENDKLHQRFQTALKQNDDLNKKCKQINQKLISASTIIKHQPSEQLLNKMKINQQWIKSLNEQNYTLKQRVFQEEYKKQREKCNQTLLKNINNTTSSIINLSNTNANDILIKEYLRQLQKKTKKTQQQKTKLQSKYSKLKGRYYQLQTKCNSMEKQINLLTIKLSGYQQLAQRQQRQIQQMIQEYHKEMDKVMINNRRKKANSEHHIKGQQTIAIQQKDKEIQQLQRQKQELLQREKQLKATVDNLQAHNKQTYLHSQQKDNLINYLQQKVHALQAQRYQIQRTNQQIQQQLLQTSQNNMDLSKTSKNYQKSENLLKTHSMTKNGGKVFVINGKTYETQVLKSKDSGQSQQGGNNDEDSLDRDVGEGNKKQGKKVNFMMPGGEISYVAGQRSYGTDPNILMNV